MKITSSQYNKMKLLNQYKDGKSASNDKFPAKLITGSKDGMIDAQSIICKTIWLSENCPTSWKQSSITLPM